MKPAPFRYHLPASIDEALALLAEYGDSAKLIAGGQSLVPAMNLRLIQPLELIDIAAIVGLDEIREDAGFIRIGSLVRHQTIADSALVRLRCPLLAEAASGIGHYAIRQRGTLGGSLAHSDPAAQLSLVAVTLDAQIEVASTRGRRVIPASEFFVAVLTTALADDEMILSVQFPVLAPAQGTAFRLFNRRRGDYAIVSAAVRIEVREDRVQWLRLAVGAVEPVPRALTELSVRQINQRPTAQWVAEVGAAARAAVAAIDQPGLCGRYRAELTEVVVERALNAALDRSRASA